MHFSTIATFLASAVAVLAAENKVTFVSTDDVHRTVYFTPSVGHGREMPSIRLAAGQKVSVTFDKGWIGNFHAVHDGKTNTGEGMLGEVTFDGYGGKTFFDVSAIVVPGDVDNISQMYPADAPNTPVSGCQVWPCNNAYWLPDDVQTKVTDQKHIITTVGKNGAGAKLAVRQDADENDVSYSHGYVTGKI